MMRKVNKVAPHQFFSGGLCLLLYLNSLNYLSLKLTFDLLKAIIP
jgi:hypothetical protein